MAEELSVHQTVLNGIEDFEFFAETDTDDEKDYKFKMLHDSVVLIVVNEASTDDCDITIKAGEFWQHTNQEYVPLETTVGTDSAKLIGPIESGKYKAHDGFVYFKAEMDGTTDDVDDLKLAVISLPLGGIEIA